MKVKLVNGMKVEFLKNGIPTEAKLYLCVDDGVDGIDTVEVAELEVDSQ